MVKIGVFSDVHNNLPALEAVLSALEQHGCRRFICCGDLIGIGPYPEATVQRLRSIPNLTAVAGNHDRYLTEGLPEVFPNSEGMEREEMLHHRWEHGLLSAESAAFLKSLPLQAEMSSEGKRICIAHYPMDAAGRYLPIDPNQLQSCGDIFLHGHDHARKIACADGQWIINPGALGCPGREKNIARAVVLTITGSDVNVQSIDVSYDAASVVQEISRLNYPSAGDIQKFFYGI